MKTSNLLTGSTKPPTAGQSSALYENDGYNRNRENPEATHHLVVRQHILGSIIRFARNREILETTALVVRLLPRRLGVYFDMVSVVVACEIEILQIQSTGLERFNRGHVACAKSQIAGLEKSLRVELNL